MKEVLKYYNGFYLKDKTGNNAFSFEQRKNKTIFVPPAMEGTANDLKVSKQISFSEIVDGKEYNINGLQNFICFMHKDVPCFIFDNHNHAFFFWAWALQKGWIGFGETLIHVDPHSDMRKPARFITKPAIKNLQNVFGYTNYELNVGNFISPAINIGVFKNCDLIDSPASFNKSYKENIVLDVDMDIFNQELNDMHDKIKILKIKEYIIQAKLITIATSPFFIDQQQAIHKIQEIFI
jgi:hypothetical protein